MKKTFFLLIITGILLASSIQVKGTENQAKRSGTTPWLMFDSSLSITYDHEMVNHTIFHIDVAVAIPITIHYRDEIPEFVFSNQILRFFFLRVLVIPNVVVSLASINTPPWADIYFSTDKLYFYIGNYNQSANTSLIISPHHDAPAQPFSLRIKANTSIIARTDRAEAFTDLTFTPEYIPFIDILTVGTIQAPPGQLTFIPFTVRNNGNDVTKITAEITNLGNLTGWTVYITPESYLPVDSSRQVNLTFFCIPPIDFEGNQTIKLLTNATQWSNPDGPYGQLTPQITVHYP